MALRVIMHVVGETPFEAELAHEPDPGSPFVLVTNPITRERRQTEWASKGTQSYYFSWARISFIEVIGDTEQETILPPYPPR